LGTIEWAFGLREQIKHVWQCVGAMPGPVSRTRSTTSRVSVETSSHICPPSSVYLAALFNRFARACASSSRKR
jgi:hypothetical protein